MFLRTSMFMSTVIDAHLQTSRCMDTNSCLTKMTSSKLSISSFELLALL